MSKRPQQCIGVIVGENGVETRCVNAPSNEKEYMGNFCVDHYQVNRMFYDRYKTSTTNALKEYVSKIKNSIQEIKTEEQSRFVLRVYARLTLAIQNRVKFMDLFVASNCRDVGHMQFIEKLENYRSNCETLLHNYHSTAAESNQKHSTKTKTKPFIAEESDDADDESELDEKTQIHTTTTPSSKTPKQLNTEIQLLLIQAVRDAKKQSEQVSACIDRIGLLLEIMMTKGLQCVQDLCPRMKNAPGGAILGIPTVLFEAHILTTVADFFVPPPKTAGVADYKVEKNPLSADTKETIRDISAIGGIGIVASDERSKKMNISLGGGGGSTSHNLYRRSLIDLTISLLHQSNLRLSDVEYIEMIITKPECLNRFVKWINSQSFRFTQGTIDQNSSERFIRIPNKTGAVPVPLDLWNVFHKWTNIRRQIFFNLVEEAESALNKNRELIVKLLKGTIDLQQDLGLHETPMAVNADTCELVNFTTAEHEEYFPLLNYVLKTMYDADSKALILDSNMKKMSLQERNHSTDNNNDLITSARSAPIVSVAANAIPVNNQNRFKHAYFHVTDNINKE
jgi:hypothetical protein